LLFSRKVPVDNQGILPSSLLTICTYGVQHTRHKVGRGVGQNDAGEGFGSGNLSLPYRATSLLPPAPFPNVCAHSPGAVRSVMKLLPGPFLPWLWLSRYIISYQACVCQGHRTRTVVARENLPFWENGKCSIAPSLRIADPAYGLLTTAFSPL
jgi:hypothetical protein